MTWPLWIHSMRKSASLSKAGRHFDGGLQTDRRNDVALGREFCFIPSLRLVHHFFDVLVRVHPYYMLSKVVKTRPSLVDFRAPCDQASIVFCSRNLNLMNRFEMAIQVVDRTETLVLAGATFKRASVGPFMPRLMLLVVALCSRGCAASCTAIAIGARLGSFRFLCC